MAKTIPQYRQEKYDKYDSLEEGKLFYRHEKNLDLVNTVEEIVYILQEENPWINKRDKNSLYTQADRFPSSIKNHILRKIEKAYRNGMPGSVWNAEIFIDKFLKRRYYKNNIKSFLSHYLGGLDAHIHKELSDNIQCFTYGGVPVFFLSQSDRDVVVRYSILSQDADAQFKGASIFLRQEHDDIIKETNFHHEYQHYLFHCFLMNGSTEQEPSSIHYKIIDELCATLIHEEPDQQKITNVILPYIKGFCNIDNIQIDGAVSEKGAVCAKVTATKEGMEVKDHNQLKDILLFLLLMPQYVQMACALIELFEKVPAFNMNKQKAIRLLSMTSPHYRKDLLTYYAKLAKYMKRKK